MHWTLPDLLALSLDDYDILVAWWHAHRRPLIDDYQDADA